MKKTRSVLVVMMALMLIVSMLPVAASADLLNVGDQAKVTASYLMYRAGPGVNYTAMAQYPAGTIVTVKEVSNAMGVWYRCKTPDGREDGWMFNTYLQKVGGTANNEVVTAAAGTDYGVTYVIKNNGNYVNLRAGGGTNYGTIDQIADGKTVIMQNKGAVWSYIKVDGKLGWVMTSFLQKAAGTNNTGNTGNTTAAAGTDYGVTYTVSNAGSYVNLRQGAGSGYGVVQQVPDGTKVTMISKNAVWSNIRVNNTTGWMMTSFLQKTAGTNNTGNTGNNTVAAGVDYGVIYTVSNAGNFVNLRDGAGSGYNVVKQVPDGTKVTMISKNAAWSFIRVNNTTGWMMTAFLQKTAGTDTTAAAGNTTVAAGADYGVAYTVTNAGNYVNLRDGAGSGYSVIRQVPDGTKVTMVSRNAAWSYINVNGTAGWMMTAFLTKTANTAANGNTVAAGTDYGTAYTVSNSGNYVNLREGAGSGYNVIMQVPDGTKVTMLSKNVTWSCIRVNNTTGWMMTSFLQKTAGTAANTNTAVAAGVDNGVAYTVKNNGNYVNLREGAGSGYGVIRQVPDGTKVTMISRNNDWSYINVNGAKGWMMTTFLQKNGTANTAAAGGTNAGAKYVISNNGMFVNLRAGAGNGYGIIQQVSDGTVVTMVDMGPVWSKILANGSTGYVMTSFLKKK